MSTLTGNLTEFVMKPTLFVLVMLFSTLLTFFLVPVVYWAFAGLQTRFATTDEEQAGILTPEPAREKAS